MAPEVIGRKFTYTPIEISAFEKTLTTAMNAKDYITQHILAVAQD